MEVAVHPALVYLLVCGVASLLKLTLADSAPTFLREPRPRIVKHNIRVKLRCKVDPKDARVWWLFNGREVTDHAELGMEVTQSYLIINSFQGKGQGSHNGDYQCRAGSEAGVVVSRVARVEAAHIKRFSGHLPETTYANEGGVAVIDCPIPESVPTAEMAYQFKGQMITGSSDHYRIMPSGYLHIINVSSLDEGQYTCTATNSFLSKMHSMGNGTRLVVQAVSSVESLPRIVTSSGATVDEGSHAVLECLPGGTPLPAVRWQRADRPMPEGAIQHPDSLELPAARREDAGVYTCTVAAGMDGDSVQVADVVLVVREAVSIAKPPKDTYVDLGGTGRFKCAVRGVAESDIAWLFNGEAVSEMSLRHDIQDGELVIHNVQRSDLGSYQCFVEADHGSEQSTARLMLKEGFPEIVDPPVNTTAIEGEDVLLSCGTTGDPMPFVSWNDPSNRAVQNTRSRFISEETGGLTIHKVDPSDVGTYRCAANNKHGQVVATAYLAVIEKLSTTPTLETSTKHVLKPPLNDKVTITTETTDDPNKPGTVPDAPSKPEITKTSDTSVQTSWTYTSSIPVTSFTVEYRDVSTTNDWITASNVIAYNQRTYEVQGLTQDDTYRFRVIATNSHGDSELSDMSNRFLMRIPEDGLVDGPLVRPPLDPPRIVNCQAISLTSILVEWEFEPEFRDIPVTGFYVHHRDTDSDDNNDYVRTPVMGEDVRQYQIRNLDAGLTYDIKMQTFNGGGASPFSNVIIRETQAPDTPLPPIILPDAPPSGYPSKNPIMPDLPDDAEPDPAGNQGEDILYITLGVVLGTMLLVLIMFGVMCMWRAKQVNNDRTARDWRYGYYHDGAYRSTNGNSYKFGGPFMNGSTPHGHGAAAAATTTYCETPADPRPLYTMPQDTLDEAGLFPGVSPLNFPTVANGLLPTSAHPSPNENSNHSDVDGVDHANTDHLHTNGSVHSLRGPAGEAASHASGQESVYGTGKRPVCPMRHQRGERSRRRKTESATSQEGSDIASDVHSTKSANPPVVAPTAPSLSHQAAEPHLSCEALDQSQEGGQCQSAKHSDI